MYRRIVECRPVTVDGGRARPAANAPDRREAAHGLPQFDGEP
ncbi:hypothetical protein BURMUCGD1_5437 [Burkholderia multivorans CGD1]|nr:hypothetical protein BURMUCGD1_5437 [Burkholderia multivorans CGD1]